jgi:hypothetical protein
MSDPEIPIRPKLLIRTKIWLNETLSRFLIWIKSTITEVSELSPKKILRHSGGEFVTIIVLPLYPFAIFFVLLYYLTSTSQAGNIRRAEATEDKPTVVRLAKGRRTAIHFWEKPERVIPGSPGKVQIDFLGNDVTVSPLASDPGNLLVYARGVRFVVLFQMVGGNGYDDVVELIPGKSKMLRAIHLDEDTYHLGQFKVVSELFGKKTETAAQAILKNGGKIALFDDLDGFEKIKSIKCGHCVFSRIDRTFVCQTPIEKIECHGTGGFKLTILKVIE